MKRTKTRHYILRRFKSIQSSIFAGVSALVLFAVMIFTVVSVRYTRNSIFENSMMYTQTITSQINQNIDSYIDYMDNIASLVADSEDVRAFLRDDDLNSEINDRILTQFTTILKGRKDIRNIGIISSEKGTLLNDGTQTINPYVDLNDLEWYGKALESDGSSELSSSHVQHVVEGERPWVITLSRGIGSGRSMDGVFLLI